MTPLGLRRTVIAGGLGIALLYYGAGRAAQPEPDHHETLYVFGTLVELVIHGAEDNAAREASAEVGALFQTLHRDWHAWEAGELGELNAAIAEGGAFRTDARLADLLREGVSLSCLSGGRFDPAIGALVALWGFHEDSPPEGAMPDAAAVAALADRAPRMSDLRFDGDTVASVNPAVQLDLGGYAKGAALDLAGALLQARGIGDAVLNAGGDVNVIGSHGDRAWRVAIRDPFVWGAVGAISLAPGEVLYTSGNYERFFEHDGARFAHIIDPRSGWPVQEIVSVSVLDTDGSRADAAATALSVAGRHDWPQVAADMGVDSVLMIADDGTMLATPAMIARLEPAAGGFPQAVEIVQLPPPSAGARCAED
jgi:FAD:protein FMN transferase